MTEASGSSHGHGNAEIVSSSIDRAYNLLSAGESVTKLEFNKSSPVPHIYFILLFYFSLWAQLVHIQL